MPISKAGKAPGKQGGFSYAMVLVAVIVIGIVAEAAHLTTWRILKAEREAELMFRGRAYMRAIESYYAANGDFPRSLQDLVKDPRSASRRHIRALYADPMARGKENAEWSLIQRDGGRVSGVASASTDEPLKKANFPKGFEKFAAAKTYGDWVFEYVPPVRPINPSAPTPPPAGPPVLRTF